MKAKVLRMLISLFFVVFLFSGTAMSWGCKKDDYYRVVPDTVLNAESRYIAVFGDLQNYFTSNYYMDYYRGSLDWISQHTDQIRFMLHTGDITNYNTNSEYEAFDSITAPYTEYLPFYTCIGNHDYRCDAPNPWIYRDSTHFNDYVGYPSAVSHIVNYYDPSSYENVLVAEELFNDEPIYLLILELEPRKSVVRWADSIARSIPDDKILLITHRYMSANGKRYLNKNYMIDEESTAPQYLWDSLIYNNDNIRCVLCGHVSSLSRVLYSTNITGRIVPQIEFNFQNQPHGGDGLIELWEFDDRGDVYVRLYNTYIQQFVNDSLTEFQFRF